MSHSLNEIEALAKRAARGVGLPWGIAEDTGKAVRWLQSHGLPGVETLGDYLIVCEGQCKADHAPLSLESPWQAHSGFLCPLTAGSSLADSAARIASGESIELRRVSHPLLLLPFAGFAALIAQCSVTIGWATTDGCALSVSQLPDTSPADVVVSRAEQFEYANEPASRGKVTPDGWKRLDAFAVRTYAPATEASRRLGAGAGNSDND